MSGDDGVKLVSHGFEVRVVITKPRLCLYAQPATIRLLNRKLLSETAKLVQSGLVALAECRIAALAEATCGGFGGSRLCPNCWLRVPVELEAPGTGARIGIARRHVNSQRHANW